MSVPVPREPRQPGGRWETIRYALDSNARTFRFCLIVIVVPAVAAVIAELMRHILLCDKAATVWNKRNGPASLGCWRGRSACAVRADQGRQDGL